MVALVATGVVTAYASGPYTSGTTGYDVSYPNCTATPSGAFAIIGVNGGRPFSSNNCIASEYSAAPTSPSPAFYINTGYATAYRKNITSACSSQSASVTGTSAQRQAWAIGCSEAQSSIGYSGQRAASMWWLDVETVNSWSSSNLTLNRYAIQGAVDRLGQASPYVGVYSTPSMWTTIAGAGFTPRGIAADWVPSGSCTTSFTSSPVWLLQSISGGLDSDFAC